MELISSRWLSDMEMEDYSFNFQSNPNSCNVNDQPMGLNMENIQQQYLVSSKTLTTCSGSSLESSKTSCFGRPVKQLKTDNSWSTSGMSTATEQQLSPNSASSSHLLTFGCATSVPKDEAVSQGYVHFKASPGMGNIYEDQKCAPKSVNNMQGTKRASTFTTRTPSSALDHIMAERKRREKLSQRFIALSAIIPGLKKMDKASVLGDAIKYLKQLQERVNALEEQTKRKTMESAVFIKRSQVSSEDDRSSCNEESDGQLDDSLPEIEARVSDKDVLIRIHAENRKGFLPEIVREVENLQLSVVNSSAVTFGTSNIDITIVAQMEVGFCVTAKDVVRKLRAASEEFMRHA